MAKRARSSSKRHGFTLVEMLAVVVIVGILAVLAVAGYRKLITSAHVSEATNTVQSIRVAQEGYHSETQSYANVSASFTAYYPQSSPVGTLLTAWGAPCLTQCTSNMDWSMLPLHVDGPVLFGYATVAGGPGVAPQPGTLSINGQSMTLPAVPTTDWFMVAATCDLDGEGAPNTTVYTTSWANQVFVDHDGS
jgi:type IV pilus assembly protein PilA